ncbi:MAG: MinD/ParA family protein [Alkaliphilus sp.]|nr:MinD/ParA family protein [Alkaliphilus sp.]
MKDQAQKLRDIVKNGSKTVKWDITKNSSLAITEEGDKTRVITVTSGKGGVGKTNFTINLGLALAKLGYKVTILDADLGLANIDVIIGLIPQYTLANVIRKEKTLQEIIVEGPRGVKIISGGSGLKEMVNLSESQLIDLVDSLKAIGKSSDFILIDTGAGINNAVLTFVYAATEVILITTPEPTSITDAYAVLKNIVAEDKDKVIRLLINRVESNEEGISIYNKINNASQRFLDISIQKLGYLYDDSIVSKSVKAQQPFLISYPNSLISQGIELIASRLINESNSDVMNVSGLKRFINKLMSKYKI